MMMEFIVWTMTIVDTKQLMFIVNLKKIIDFSDTSLNSDSLSRFSASIYKTKEILG